MKTKNVKLDPQLAISYFQQGRLVEAQEVLEAILESSPKFAYGWFVLGIIHNQQGQFEKAKNSLAKSIKLQPQYPEAHNNLGVICEKLNQLEQAKIAYKTAVKQKPDYPNALYNLANVLKAEGDYQEAIDYYHQAMKLDPNYVNAITNLGVTYQLLMNHEKAISLFQRALLIAPNDVTLLNNIGLSYFYQFNYNKALDYYQKALSLAPGLSSAFVNIAQVLQSTGEYQAARQYFEKAKSDELQRESALNNIALLELGQLNFKEGWQLYKYRPSIKTFSKNIPDSLPDNLQGLNILLQKDQGLGDEIFFLRFVNHLLENKAHVSYLADSRLTTILSRSVEGLTIIPEITQQNSFDYVLPVSELPRLLLNRLVKTIPPSLKLTIAEKNLQQIKNEIPANKKKNIAITWQAGTPETNRLYKRIDPELLGNMLRYVDANILILQRNPSKADIKKLEKAMGRKAFNYAYINNDLEDTLAFLSLMDEYVTVSNTNIHLHAAIGKSAKVLVPHPPEWRWTFNETRSPWFPGFSLYRQDSHGQWDNVLNQCLEDLQSN